MQRVGFIGASGLMGHGVAKNLRAKGFPLSIKVHRKSPARGRLAGTKITRREGQPGYQLSSSGASLLRQTSERSITSHSPPDVRHVAYAMLRRSRARSGPA